MLERMIRLLRDAPPKQGQVSRVDAAGVWVTVGGRAFVARRQSGDATAYRVGDTVRLSGDVVTGRVNRRKVRRYVV